MFYLLKLMSKNKRWFFLAIVMMSFSAFLTIVQANAIARVFSITMDVKNIDFSTTPRNNTLEETSILEKIKQFFTIYFEHGNQDAISYLVQQNSFSLLLLVVFGFLSVVFFLQIISYFKDISNEYLSVIATSKLRENVFSKLIDLPVNYFKKKQNSLILSRLSDDLSQTRVLMVKILEAGLYGPILGFMGLIAVFTINYKFILIGALIVFTISIVINFISSYLKRFVHRVQKQMEIILSKIQKTLYGIEVVKIFNQNQEEKKQFHQVNEEYQKLNLKQILFTALNRPLTEFFTFLAIICILVYIILLIWSQEMHIDDMLNIFTLGLFISPYIQRFGTVFFMKEQVDVYVDRCLEILKEKEEEEDTQSHFKPPLLDCTGNISLDKVEYSYENTPVLNKVSFESKKGELVAIVGPSGSGKTTLIHILCGFYRPTNGFYYLDQNSTNNLTLENIRNFTSLVSQDNILFPMTIRENIAYGNSLASDEDIIQVAKDAHIHSFIKSLTHGYDTLLSDMGKSLSGGQRQRICLARALLKNAPILILDEATSALDSESETFIQQTIQQLRGKKTIFVIAHRMKTIQNADNILVLEQGKIVESGHHKNLMKKLGAYYKYIQLQNI